MSGAPHAVEERGNTYDKYATQNRLERRMMDGFLAALDASLPEESPARVLEVGTGEGEVAARVSERFPEAEVNGLDLPSDELARHWAGRDLSGLFGDVTALPFPDGAFDLVLAIEVLEHVPDPAAGLTELARVSSRDLVVSVPREPIWRLGNLARGRYVGAAGNTPGHINHWGARRFVRFVSRAVEVVDVHRPLPWTMVRARTHRISA